MARSFPMILLLGALAVPVGLPALSFSGAPGVPDPTCAGCGGRNNVHSASCPYVQGHGRGSPSKPRGLSPEASIKVQITGMVFESLLTSLFSEGSGDASAKAKAAELAARQMAAEQAARAAAAQAAYDRMMQSYKRLEGSEGVAFKTLSASAAGYKTLGGSGEDLAAGARTPFDAAGRPPPAAAPSLSGGGAPFFGDTMPIADIRLLVDPENDPRVVDLRAAKDFVARELEAEETRTAEAARAPDEAREAENKAAPTPVACDLLDSRLNALLDQRSRFQKTVLLAQDQLDTWKSANRNALLNAAQDGVEYLVGQYLEVLGNRGKAADRLAALLEKNAAQMAQEGIDTGALAARTARLRALGNAGHAAAFASQLNDGTAFAKEGSSALLVRLTAENAEMQELLRDPRMAKYIDADSPGLAALFDLSKIGASEKVLGKWAAKKVPLVAALELSVKQAYNATEWYLSFSRIAEAHRINGQVAAAARALQADIDEVRFAAGACPP